MEGDFNSQFFDPLDEMRLHYLTSWTFLGEVGIYSTTSTAHLQFLGHCLKSFLSTNGLSSKSSVLLE